jgi:hypothetical protein
VNLSPHFTLAELTRTDHREFDNTPDQSSIENLTRLADLLEQVREAVKGRPVVINSGYRSEAVNKAVGSSDKSQHRIGCAADIRVLGFTPNQVVKAVIAAGIPFDQVIREFDSWTHISVPSTKEMTPRKQALIIDRTGTRIFS